MIYRLPTTKIKRPMLTRLKAISFLLLNKRVGKRRSKYNKITLVFCSSKLQTTEIGDNLTWLPASAPTKIQFHAAVITFIFLR